MIMTKERTPFMPLDSDIDDDKLEQLAEAKGVAKLVKPASDEAGEGSSPTPKRKASPAAKDATPRERMKTINLELPDYVWTDLKIRAAKEQVSLRHIVMTALKSYGVEIAESDMIQDGRRMR